MIESLSLQDSSFLRSHVFDDSTTGKLPSLSSCRIMHALLEDRRNSQFTIHNFLSLCDAVKTYVSDNEPCRVISNL